MQLNAEGVYQTPEVFLNEAFANAPPTAKMLWLTGDIGKTATQILQHKPASLRTRYWVKGKRGAWILEEIGKEKPITVGIMINEDRIQNIRVLVFRESRGHEVRHNFFTDQFKQASLQVDLQLDRHIDGITGATLSVRALRRLARLALYLHKQTTK